MLISQLDAGSLTETEMTKLLFEGISDDGKQGDCIFVLGSQSALKYRVPRAIELYQEGRARKLLFSGGTKWEGRDYPEAIEMKNAAVECGIPEDDILIDILSHHTKENVLASLLVLDRAFQLHNLRRLLVVTTTFHMRRTLLTLKTYMPRWIEYTLCPVDDATTRMDNWWLHDSGTRRVKGECAKLIMYVKNGVLVDDEYEHGD